MKFIKQPYILSKLIITCLLSSLIGCSPVENNLEKPEFIYLNEFNTGPRYTCKHWTSTGQCIHLMPAEEDALINIKTN